MIDIFSDFDFELLKSEEFKEDSVREELILPLIKALGYSSRGSNRIVRSKKLIHPFVSTGSSEVRLTNFPDYTFEVDGKFAWVLDAKGPGEQIISGENRQQAYFYAIHPEVNVSYYALCNGSHFVLFHISQNDAVLYIPLPEIEKHWQKLGKILSAEAFSHRFDTWASDVASVGSKFDYLSARPPSEIRNIRKQSARRHFGVHGYFTKQAYEILQAYISAFTKPGDLVLDPFGGTGVTLIESLMLDRKAIHIDLNPLSVFWVRTLIEPVSPSALIAAFRWVTKKYRSRTIETEADYEEILNEFPYPSGIVLPKSSDVGTIEELFTRRQLAQLAYLKHIILSVEDELVRNHLLLSFSSSLNKFNRTFHYTRSDGGGDSAVFRYYRYRIAPNPGQLDLMDVFNTKFNRLFAAKKSISSVITKKSVRNARVIKGTATNLEEVPDASVDYIYTDPPYGKKIQYLDLSIMWNAWLDLEVSEQDYKEEAIEGGEFSKSKADYSRLIADSIKEMYRVLKFGRWMSFVFQHQDPAYWHLIVESAERAGFEYAGAVRQNNGQTSFKKRQRPFTVLSGQLIINFKKVKNPKSIMKTNLGADVTDLVYTAIEKIIAERSGATLEEINDEVVIKFMELNILDLVARKYKDLTPFLNENFDHDEETGRYNLFKETKFKASIPVETRIKYYLISMMRRMARDGVFPHIDDIYLEIMPLLKNGTTPEKQTILNVLETIAERTGLDQWKLMESGQGALFEK